MLCRYPTAVGAKPVGGLKRQSGLVDWRLRTGGLGVPGILGILWTAVWSALPVSDNSWSEAGRRSYHTGLSGSASRLTVRNCPFRSVTVRISALAPRGSLAVRQPIPHTHSHPPVRLQPDDRRKSQRAYFRGVIAPLFASFVKAAARAWTHVLNRADVRRQGSREQARTPRVKARSPRVLVDRIDDQTITINGTFQRNTEEGVVVNVFGALA